MLDEFPLEPDQYVSGHPGVRTGADSQVDVGFWQGELDEEDFGHLLVVVLPGVDDPLLVAECRERPDHRSRLDEVRPGPEYMRDRRAHRLPWNCPVAATAGRAAPAEVEITVNSPAAGPAHHIWAGKWPGIHVIGMSPSELGCTCTSIRRRDSSLLPAS